MPPRSCVAAADIAPASPRVVLAVPVIAVLAVPVTALGSVWGAYVGLYCCRTNTLNRNNTEEALVRLDFVRSSQLAGGLLVVFPCNAAHCAHATCS